MNTVLVLISLSLPLNVEPRKPVTSQQLTIAPAIGVVVGTAPK